MLMRSGQSGRGLQMDERVASGPYAEFQTSGLPTFIEHAQLMPAAVERLGEGSIQRTLAQRLAIEKPPAPTAAAQGRKTQP